jgi:NAD(P)-dependent dehydrogenase (short-subunit alcohol dehydrogenase family)
LRRPLASLGSKTLLGYVAAYSHLTVKYVSSKHAINGFTKVAAIEYSKHGIRVNSVCPGVIETNLGRAAPKELVEENLTPVINATPIGRPGQTEEVANVVGFLCSQRSSFVSGSCMTVQIPCTQTDL